MTPRTLPESRHGTGADTPPPGNAVAAVCLHAALTALLLVLMLQTGLPLAAAAGLAWIGGATGTVALLLGSAAVAQRVSLPLTARAPRHPATAPDL